MEPQPLGLGDVGDRGDRVHRRRGRGAERGDDRDRAPPGGAIGGDGRSKRVGVELEALVRRDADQRVAPQAERHARLLDRAVRLGRGVDPQRGKVGPTGQALLGGVDAGRLSCRGQRDQRRRRGGVGQQAVEGRRQPERLAQPVHHDAFELGADRRGPPQHRVLAEGRGQHLAEDPGTGRGRREVGEEARVLPVGGVRLDQAPVVGEDRVDRLGALGRGRREERPERSRLDRREDVPRLDGLEVVGHHVDHGVRRRAELRGRHVAGQRLRWVVGSRVGHAPECTEARRP